MKRFTIALLVLLAFTACSKKIVKELPPSPTQATLPAPAPTIESATSKGISENKSVAVINPLKDPNNILSKRSIYFDFDDYNVKNEYRTLIGAHANYLISHPEATIRIEGNADDRGSREYNLALGQKRAVAVKRFMNLLGVQDKQIETISYGEEKPKATGQDEASWAENRRDDLYYSGE